MIMNELSKEVKDTISSRAFSCCVMLTENILNVMKKEIGDDSHLSNNSILCKWIKKRLEK